MNNTTALTHPPRIFDTKAHGVLRREDQGPHEEPGLLRKKHDQHGVLAESRGVVHSVESDGHSPNIYNRSHVPSTI